MSIKTPHEEQDTFVCPDKPKEEPKPTVDTYTRVKDSVWKNDRTGQFETFNYPLNPRRPL